MTRKEKEQYNRWKSDETSNLTNDRFIEELARFWETHDLADFEQDLEEADEPVFVRRTGTSLTIDHNP
jgi:hypothetical protein